MGAPYSSGGSIRRRNEDGAAVGNRQLCRNRAKTKSHAYLADHRVYQQAVLPATAYLEMALAAGASVTKSSDLVLDAERVLIQQALILPDGPDEARELVVPAACHLAMVFSAAEVQFGTSNRPTGSFDSVYTVIQDVINPDGHHLLSAIYSEETPDYLAEIPSVQIMRHL